METDSVNALALVNNKRECLQASYRVRTCPALDISTKTHFRTAHTF